MPVLGALRRDPTMAWRERHLGLVPVAERPDEVRSALDRLAVAIRDQLDLEAIMAVAVAAPDRSVAPPPFAAPGGKCRMAVAAGPAFSFAYPDNLELLAEAGAELVPFDPLCDAALPDHLGGMVAGGGFPEVFAPALAENRPLLADVRSRVDRGLATWAECGGLLWLGDRLDNHVLCGVIDTRGRMTNQLTLGYRTATFQTATPLGPAGTVVRGHEFHYSTLDPLGRALALEGGPGPVLGGWASPTMLASYVHFHLAGAPQLATELVRTACASQAASAS
jgi:cobyrinic acid a,c-diamide synthase